MLAHPRAAWSLRVVVILAGVGLFPLLGGEFMPKLEEGNLWVRATLPMSISMNQSAKYTDRMRDIIRGCPADKATPCTPDNQRYPEVLGTTSQLGRPDDGTDVTGFFNIEFFVPLRPADQWRPGMTKEKLTDALGVELGAEFPGVVFNFSQIIGDNVEEAVAGVKGENSVKVFGPDIEANESLADAVIEALASVPGVQDLGKLTSVGQPDVKITPDRRACARYGLNTGDVADVVQTAIGGQAVTQLYQREKAFDVTVRFLPAYRESIEAIREIQMPTPGGLMVPLGSLASIQLREGPSSIYREDLQRYTPVKFSVRKRDLEGAILAAQAKVAQTVKLPYDSHLSWGGQINELRDAQHRLMFIVPLTLLIVAVFVYMAVKTWLDTLIVLIDIPIACTGGLLALILTGTNFSISAAMGFLSIFGVAIQDAILVVTYFQRQHYVLGMSALRGGQGGGREALPPGADDHLGRDAGPLARGAQPRNRLADPAAPGHRCDRRLHHLGPADPHHPAAPLGRVTSVVGRAQAAQPAATPTPSRPQSTEGSGAVACVGYPLRRRARHSRRPPPKTSPPGRGPGARCASAARYRRRCCGRRSAPVCPWAAASRSQRWRRSPSRATPSPPRPKIRARFLPKRATVCCRPGRRRRCPIWR